MRLVVRGARRAVMLRTRPICSLTQVPEFTRYASPAGSFLRLPELTGDWIPGFVREIEPILANARHQSNFAPLGLTVAVARPPGADLLVGHELVDVVEPLAAALSLPQLRHVSATKAHGGTSTLCIGPVGLNITDSRGWHTGRARTTDVTLSAQRDVGRQIALQIASARWGPGRLDLAIRTGVLRDWIGTWTPLVHSLVAILGRRHGNVGELDIEDGRIVSLALHHDVDPLLGDTIEVDVRWRLLERVGGGPALNYEIPSISARA